MAVSLTSGAISKIVTGKCTENDMKPVLQVTDIQSLPVFSKDGKQPYSIVLSDGSVCIDGSITENINEMIRSKQLQKGSVVQLTMFSSITDSFDSYISVRDLNVIRCNCIILGDPKPFHGNMTPPVNNFITPKSEEDHVDPDVNNVNDDRHHADEHTASKQKCSSCSQTQSRKRQRQSSDDKEDEIGACFEKMEKLGWGEGPMYDTAVLLFGESSDYRKIWLHLKPNSCVNWVKNAGSKYGLLG